MLRPASAPWIVRGATFALWALAAGSAAYWGLKLSAATRAVSAPVAAPRQVGPVDPMAMARLLGSTPTAAAAAPALPALASRLQLLGVAAGANSGGGAAVISVDGKPARPYRVGSAIEEGLVLQSVRGRQAVVAGGDGRPLLTLELPPQRLAESGRPAPMAVPPGAPQGVPQAGTQPAPVIAPFRQVAPPPDVIPNLPPVEGSQAPNDAPR